MPLTPQAGVARLRAFQLGKESTFKVQTPATRRLPWATGGWPVIDPHWTEPTGDTGTLDWALPVYQQATDITDAATFDAFSNDMPNLWAALLKGGVTPTGAGPYTWTYTPASTSQDVFDTFTGEWFDDSGDNVTAMGGVVNDATITFPQSLQPASVSSNWRYAKIATYPATPTGALSVDPAPVPLFAADTAFYIDDTAGAIGGNQLVDTIYDATVTIQNNLDIKRFQNGYATRFEVDNYGRGLREVTATITFAKTTAAILEATDWLVGSSGAPVERFASILTQSTIIAGAGIPHSQRISFSGYWMTRSEQTINNNTAFQLNFHGRFNPSGLNYPIQVVAVNSRATL